MVAGGFEGMTFRGHPSHHIRQLDVGRERGGSLEEEVGKVGRLAGVVITPPFFLYALCACLTVRPFLCVPFGCSSGLPSPPLTSPPPPKHTLPTTTGLAAMVANVDVTTFLPLGPLPPTYEFFSSKSIFSRQVELLVGTHQKSTGKGEHFAL